MPGVKPSIAFERDTRAKFPVEFFPRFRTKRGTNPLERYFLDVETVGMNFGPLPPRDSLFHAQYMAIGEFGIPSVVHGRLTQ